MHAPSDVATCSLNLADLSRCWISLNHGRLFHSLTLPTSPSNLVTTVTDALVHSMSSATTSLPAAFAPAEGVWEWLNITWVKRGQALYELSHRGVKLRINLGLSSRS